MSILEQASEVDIKEYYTVIPDSGGAVKIVDGPFEGLIYKYGEFKLTRPKSEDDTLNFKTVFGIGTHLQHARCYAYALSILDQF